MHNPETSSQPRVASAQPRGAGFQPASAPGGASPQPRGAGFQPAGAPGGASPQPRGAGFQPASGRPIPESLVRYRRNLPHWQAGGSTYFLTFRLQAEPLTAEERRLVRDAILFWHPQRWMVHALSVMPDHAHVVATPTEGLPGNWHALNVILHSVKAHTGREINRRRGGSGQFWQRETYDRIIRDEREYQEALDYVLNNAVTAGLVNDGWDYDGFWCWQTSG